MALNFEVRTQVRDKAIAYQCFLLALRCTHVVNC